MEASAHWGGTSNAGVRARSGGRTSPPPTRLVSSTLGASLSQHGGITPQLNRLRCGEVLLQKRAGAINAGLPLPQRSAEVRRGERGLESAGRNEWGPNTDDMCARSLRRFDCPRQALAPLAKTKSFGMTPPTLS